MSPSFNSYLNEIARYPLLTVDQEIQYGRRIAKMRELQGLERPLTDAEQRLVRSGQRARERFMQCNLQLVVHVAKKYENRKRKSLEIMDLIQEGNIGLARAVELFDSSRGYKFSTYAYWWIRQAVTRWADQHSRLISIPGSHCQHLGRIGPITRRLEQELNRPPTRQEIADELGVSLAVLDQVVENGRSIASLDQVISDDGLELGATCASFDRSIEDEEEQRERWRQAEQLRNMIARLPMSDQRLLVLAWGLDGVEIPRAELARQEGLSTRALESHLERLQASLAAHSVQLALVAVCRVRPSPRPRMKRKRRGCVGEQLRLVVVT
jgi:RNA polymerase primary sigma factor